MSGSVQDLAKLAMVKGRLIVAGWQSRRRHFECPICGHAGCFEALATPAGVRKYARCPGCQALERHRLQCLVFDTVFEHRDCSPLSMLHIAPESFLAKRFAARFGRYETADLRAADVDRRVDLQALPLADASYDVVYASHVLEHIRDDRKAIAEIRRILRPGGIAIPPVPVVASETLEYDTAEGCNSYHWRAPGLDYFERYKVAFDTVQVYASSDFHEKYQLYVNNDRTQARRGRRSGLSVGDKNGRYPEFVPVCRV